MATIDVQVGASADDGYVHSAGGLNNNNNVVLAGNTSSLVFHSFFRFTGITIPQSSVIDVAHISLYEKTSQGTPLTKIYADDQNNPAAVANYADYGSRTLTTAGVDMDGDPGAAAWYNSPSIVSVIQELVDSYDYSNQAIQIMHKDDGSGSEIYRHSRSYDDTTSPANTWGPKLHIEYTAGGGAVYLRYDENMGQRTLDTTKAQMYYEHSSGQRTMLSTAPKALEYDTSNAGVKAS